LRESEERCEPYLVLQIIPPVGPRLFDATFLLDNRIWYNGTQDAERHRDTVVVIAMYDRTTGEGVEWATVHLKSIIQFFGLHAEFGCEGSVSHK
jgi:hypothetical protein